MVDMGGSGLCSLFPEPVASPLPLLPCLLAAPLLFGWGRGASFPGVACCLDPEFSAPSPPQNHAGDDAPLLYLLERPSMPAGGPPRGGAPLGALKQLDLSFNWIQVGRWLELVGVVGGGWVGCNCPALTPHLQQARREGGLPLAHFPHPSSLPPPLSLIVPPSPPSPTPLCRRMLPAGCCSH